MTDTEIRDKIVQLHTTIFGVEGQGGVVGEIEDMSKRITECEARLNTFSGKWLALMAVLALIGQFAATALARYFFH